MIGPLHVDNGILSDLSISQELRLEGRSNEVFEIMLSSLTIEELIALKIECSMRLTNGKLYGFNLWNRIIEIAKEGLYIAAISITNSNTEAARLLGINYSLFTVLAKKYGKKKLFSMLEDTTP
jgi:hypothetical protein